jgi:hypothetical protein
MSGQYQIYKKAGALQASLIRYQPPSDGRKHRSGAVYYEVSKCTDFDKKVYDWGNKIGFALFPGDINKILNDLRLKPGQPITLIHQKDDVSKKLVLKPGDPNNDRYRGTWMLQFTMKTGNGNPNSVTIPLSGGEFETMIVLIKAALPAIFGWDISGVQEVERTRNRT